VSTKHHQHQPGTLILGLLIVKQSSTGWACRKKEMLDKNYARTVKDELETKPNQIRSAF